ncbi:MAG: discoidin domain-containing protein, partial [Caldilineaceae bacterium]|nr:discoidin domain-containing protein [Caldilineaceae bacterium]
MRKQSRQTQENCAQAVAASHPPRQQALLVALGLGLALLWSLLEMPTLHAQATSCSHTITSSHKGENNTTAKATMDGDLKSYFDSSHKDWQYIQIDLGCEQRFSALRRYMSSDGATVKGTRTGQGEGVTYSLDGKTWHELTGPTTTGWEKYVNYGARQHAWHTVPYGWSAWLALQTPVRARYLRFQWDDNGDALHEIEVKVSDGSTGGGSNPPGDNTMLVWAQDNVGGRRVLLHWFGAKPSESYTLFRRAQGSANWNAVGNTAFAPNAAAMTTILGPNLTNQLAIDLDDNAADGPLSAEQLYQTLRTNQLAQIKLAEQHYEVALAVGSGYLDSSAPTGQTLEYYVAHQGTTAPLFGPVAIAANPGPYPLPTDVRESLLFQAVGDLGVPGSTRPLDAVERTNWDRYQVLQAVDGKALLHWNATQQGTPTHYIAGYHIYRRGAPTGNSWQLANAQEPHQVRADLVAPNATAQITGDFTVDTGFIDDANFEDELRAHFPNLPVTALYGPWRYRICPVDLLGNEQGCTADAVVRVRELHSPAAPNNLTIGADAQHTQLAVTVRYSDTAEVSLPAQLFLLRHETANAPIAQWTAVASTAVNQVNPTTVVNFSDVPPRGRPFWYRVQVRDNAGNWSPAGTPVSAGLYPRTPPPFAPIPQNPDCNLNTMPLTLSNLDGVIRQIVVYRSFVPGEVGTLLKRVAVVNGAALIREDFVPPYTQIAYYQLEAVDGHGNHSLPQPYCARLDPEGTPANP